MAIYSEQLQKQAATVLRDAAETIEKHGWVRGFLGGKTTGYCAVGAINAVTDIFGANRRLSQAVAARTLFQEWLLDHLGVEAFSYSPCSCSRCNNSIESWNDAPGNSKEMVIQTMRKAADDLAPQVW